MLPFELIKDTPHLALSGELWSVFYEYVKRNWSCYRGFLLYLIPAMIFTGVRVPKWHKQNGITGGCIYPDNIYMETHRHNTASDERIMSQLH